MSSFKIRYSGVNLYARLAEDGSAKTAESIDSNLNIGEKRYNSANFENCKRKREAGHRDSYPEFMAQLIEDLPRASSEINRIHLRDAVKVIGRIISRKLLARKLLLHGRVRVDSSTCIWCVERWTN